MLNNSGILKIKSTCNILLLRTYHDQRLGYKLPSKNHQKLVTPNPRSTSSASVVQLHSSQSNSPNTSHAEKKSGTTWMCHVETIFDLSNSRTPDYHCFLPWKYEHVTRWEQQKRRRKGEQRVAAIQAGERSRAGTTVASTMELRAATSPEGRGIVQRNGERRDDGTVSSRTRKKGQNELVHSVL